MLNYSYKEIIYNALLINFSQQKKKNTWLNNDKLLPDNSR